jgi:ribonuclease G
MRARQRRSFRLPWFRWRKQKQQEQAAQQAAPVTPEQAEEEKRVEETPPAPTGEQARKKRRRGSRGGRGRSKTGAGAGAAQAEAAPKEGGRAQPQRKSERPQRSQQRRRQAPRRAPLPKAKRDLLISADVGEQRVAVLEDDQVAEVYLERPERRSIAGNIYKGKVDNVLPGMEAAFVELGLERNGFLYVDEIVAPELEGRGNRKIQDLIKRGQDILVQAVKDPMKSKGARLTTEISLPGRFVVFVPSGEGLGVSRRLEDAERNRLREILKGLDIPTGGIIVRTAAEGASAGDIERDLIFLQRLWKEIQKREAQVKSPALVYQEAELPLRVIRDLFTDDFERALIDDDRTYKRVTGYLKKTSPHMVDRVSRYRDKEPLFEAHGVDAQIRSTLSRRVDLPSGGYLVFDYAEAFTVIDVNTGRFTGARGKGSDARLEDTITKNNLEAVKEVVRQLRLRDIGGIIVIDFIDMANPKNRASVEEALKTELERDRTKTYVVEISPLGLVEMTRQNVTDGPREILTERCPTCEGDGIVPSAQTAAIDVERKLRALGRGSRNQAFRVEVNARVAALLAGPGASRLREIEEEAKRRFWLVTRKDVPADHFAVLAQGSRQKLAPEAKFAEGDEKRIELGEIGLYDPTAGVGRVDGSPIVVGNAAGQVGKRVRVRVERILDGVAYGTLIAGANEEVLEPITAESLAEKPTRQPRSRVKEETEPEAVEAVAEEEEPVEEEASADEKPSAEEQPSAEAKPKRKRGSRGGRRRRKKPAGAVANDSQNGSQNGGRKSAAEKSAAGPKIHVPEPELGRADDSEAPATDGAAPQQTEAQAGQDGQPKPRKKTRRGSRGGRRRRKKTGTAASTGGGSPASGGGG